MPHHQFQPMLLGRRAEAFDHPDWLFELKYDGFRSLAFIEGGRCRLVSRNGNQFKSFEELALALPREVRASSAVLDGEIVCLNREGKPNFGDLFYRRKEPIFVAFDLLSMNSQDFRSLPLIDRKAELKRILRQNTERTLYCEHVIGNGIGLFELACKHDLEGIVGKLKSGRYICGREQTSWLKIRNRDYPQWEGRHEMFERPHEPVVPDWNSCTQACAEFTA